MLLAEYTVLAMAYLVCFLLGLGYAVIAGIFSAVGGGGGGGEGPADIGVDIDAGGEIDLGGGHDVVSGIEVDAGDLGGHEPGGISTDPGVSPFSPPVVAMTLITFGATGIIFTKWVKLGSLSLLPAGLSGICMGLVTFLFFYAMIRKIQGSSSPGLVEVIGVEAEATTPIPPDGVGEIAYVARGTRFTARARSTTDQTLASHTAVKIVKWVGHTAQVEPVE